MKKALFHPFDIQKWFVVGFTAFLAGLLNGNPSANFSNSIDKRNINVDNIERIPQIVMEWINTHPFLFILILAVIVFVFILLVILTWLSSRGSFMFLDNVVGDRARVSAPWHQFRFLGNSLFLWRIGFGLLCFLVTLPFVVLSILTLLPLMHGPGAGGYLIIFICLVGVTVLLSLIAAYISMFANNFVVPIMYKHNLQVIAAWKVFIPILKSNLLHFLFYGLFLLLLGIGVGIAVIFTGCVTCCLFFILLMIPYINAVVLLPVSYTYRAYSLEFLAQFGPEYSLFPIPPPPPSVEPAIPGPNPSASE